MSDRIKSWIFCVLFFGGLLLGGSEGQHFPWPNMAGAVLILMGAFLIPAVERYADEPDADE